MRQRKQRGNNVAVLDTFYILFKSDSAEAEKSLKRLNTQLTGVESSLGRVGRRWFSLYALINGIGHSFRYAFELNAASEALGVNAEALSLWGGAVTKTGGTLKGFESSLESLAKHLGTTPKIALEVLPKLSDQFQRLSRFQALKYGKLIGLDTPTILLLQQGRRELDAIINRQRELGVVTKRDSEIFGKFKNELEDTGHGFRSLFYQVALAVLPTLSKVLHGIQDVSISLRKHSGFIKGALLVLGAAAALAAAPFIILNAGAIAAAAAVTAFAVAVGLAWDDVQTFLRGGDSLIGRLMERFPELKVIAVNSFNEMSDSLNRFKHDMGVLLKWVSALVDAFKYLDEKVVTPIQEKLGFTGVGKNLYLSLLTGQKELLTASNNPISSQTSNSIFNNTSRNVRESNISIGEIKIETQATNPREIAYGLNVELQNQFRQTQNNLANGVLI
jgi:hypothetical protein